MSTLGGHCVTLRGEELGLGSRESVADVARTLASYCTMVGARVFDHRVLEEMARLGGIPVVTAGVGYWDNRAHAPDEHVRVQDFLNGSRHIARIMDGFAGI